MAVSNCFLPLTPETGDTVTDTKYRFSKNHYWVFEVVLDEMSPLTVTDAMRQLGELGVGTRPFFSPMHKQPFFQEMGLFHEEKFPVSERLARSGFYLPSGTAITDQQIEYVAKKVRLVLS